MKDDEAERIRTLVNRSGFPLQIGVEQYIRKTVDDHHCRVLYVEHSWRNPESRANGFIDIVVEHEESGCVFVIECKRVLEGSWIFLNPGANRRHAKLWVTESDSRGFRQFGWGDCLVEPRTPESTYCVIPHKEPRRRILEPLAAEVVAATEAFAWEDRIRVKQKGKVIVTYASVIVTTSPIHLAAFDANEVSLVDGTVPELKEKVVVPYLRFRKQLSSQVWDWDRRGDIELPERLDYAKERTVFIVNAAHLNDFLVPFEVGQAAY
jgi:hypothetical protein